MDGRESLYCCLTLFDIPASPCLWRNYNATTRCSILTDPQGSKRRRSRSLGYMCVEMAYSAGAVELIERSSRDR